MACVVATSCGRVNFDPLTEDSGGSSSVDGQLAACMPQTIASCPDATILDARVGLARSVTVTTPATTHDLQANRCLSGFGSPEILFAVVPTTDGMYTVTVEAGNPFFVLYVLDGCCGGVELDCGLVSAPITIARTAGQTFTVVVDGGPSTDTRLTVTGSM